MKLIVSALLVVTGCYSIKAQRTVGTGISQSAGNPTIVQARPFGLITEKDLDFNRSNTDFFFLYTGWKFGSIQLLNNSIIEDVEFKYDIRYNVFEFNNESENRFLSGKKVKEFILFDDEERVFHNALYIKGFNFIGFVEVLVDGEYALYEHQTFEIQKANYIPALDAGEQKDKLIKKSDFYLFAYDIGSRIPGKKRKFVELFGDDRGLAKNILTENKYKLRNRVDLIDFFRQLNDTINVR